MSPIKRLIFKSVLILSLTGTGFVTGARADDPTDTASPSPSESPSPSPSASPSPLASIPPGLNYTCAVHLEGDSYSITLAENADGSFTGAIEDLTTQDSSNMAIVATVNSSGTALNFTMIGIVTSLNSANSVIQLTIDPVANLADLSISEFVVNTTNLLNIAVRSGISCTPG
jgi:hypothetical protein